MDQGEITRISERVLREFGQTEWPEVHHEVDGMVAVTVSGNYRLTEVRLLDPGIEHELARRLEAAIARAVNDALGEMGLRVGQGLLAAVKRETGDAKR
jgi:DNA-binding protein YbaB